MDTYINAGWDVGSANNGTCGIWSAPSGKVYPVLWWASQAGCPLPAFSGGSGTEGDPYLIANADDLRAIGADPRLTDKRFRLVVDLDLQGVDHSLDSW